MKIETVNPTRVLHDWEFVFSSGIMLPVTMEPLVGDYMTRTPDLITIHRAAVPNLHNPEVLTPREEILIYPGNLCFSRETIREVVTTPEVQADWAEAFKTMTTPKTVN